MWQLGDISAARPNGQGLNRCWVRIGPVLHKAHDVRIVHTLQVQHGPGPFEKCEAAQPRHRVGFWSYPPSFRPLKSKSPSFSLRYIRSDDVQREEEITATKGRTASFNFDFYFSSAWWLTFQLRPTERGVT